MQKKRIIQYAFIGLIGSLLMFVGDMLIYFTTEAVPTEDIALLMKLSEQSHWRLFAGGLVAPLAILLSVFGYMGLWGIVERKSAGSSYVALLVLLLGSLMNMAYHILFPVFGLIASREVVEQIFPYLELWGYSSFVLMNIAWLIYAILIVMNKTIVPRWAVLCLPVVTVWLGALWHLFPLPQPYHTIVAGGWNDLIQTFFFVVY